jgi:hypothetical protein
MSPVPFMLAVIPLSVLTTWIFVLTRSGVFIAILFHAWFDVVLLYGFAMVAQSDGALTWWMFGVTQTALAIVVVAIWGRNLVRRPAPDAEAKRPAAATA